MNILRDVRFYIKRENSDTPGYDCELVNEQPAADNLIIEGKTSSLLFKRVKERIDSPFPDSESNVK